MSNENEDIVRKGSIVNATDDPSDCADTGIVTSTDGHRASVYWIQAGQTYLEEIDDLVVDVDATRRVRTAYGAA